MISKSSPLIFERSKKDRYAYSLPQNDIENISIASLLDDKYIRKHKAEFPEVSELDLVRHYTELSNKNFGVDTGFYPLGSCTMKYNPKINEKVARISGFSESHPLQEEEHVQGSLEIIYSLQEELKEITGMDEVTLQPAAGAHGEWTALMIFKAYHEKNGQSHRDEVIVPDSAHGTNPASASFAGFKSVTVKSNQRGEVDIEDLKRVVNDNTAAIMLTNPNTLGIFEQNIIEIGKIVHEAGGLLYYDGANLNAILDKVRPGDMGFDAVHLNLHKTFTGPHGGGGPGSFSGVLALGIHSVGMLGKLFVEDIESLDFSAVESLKASGANKMKTLMFAVIPQILPSFISLILYRFELNLRSASILGLIGAGGIGTPLIFALQTRSWDRVGMILIGLIAMVALVDLISGAVRKRIV